MKTAEEKWLLHEESPFNMPIDALKLKMTGKSEARGDKLLIEHSFKKVKTGQFFKIFSWAVPLLVELSPAAVMLFLWIGSNIGQGKNEIELHTLVLQKALRYNNPKQIYVALRELADNNIIAKTTLSNHWWVNTMIVSNGDDRHYTKKL